MTGNYNEAKTMYGNFGTVFLDDSFVAEATAIQAKIKMNKLDVPMCGTTSKKYRTVGWEGSGTLTLNKISSRMITLLADDFKNGTEQAYTLLSKLKDPANGGTETIKLKGVKFDELTLTDWAANKLGTESIPFTFDDFDVVDSIGA